MPAPAGNRPTVPGVYRAIIGDAGERTVLVALRRGVLMAAWVSKDGELVTERLWSVNFKTWTPVAEEAEA